MEIFRRIKLETIRELRRMSDSKFVRQLDRVQWIRSFSIYDIPSSQKHGQRHILTESVTSDGKHWQARIGVGNWNIAEDIQIMAKSFASAHFKVVQSNYKELLRT